MDGFEVAVNESLATALRHLRSSDQRVLVWADALVLIRQIVKRRNNR